MTTWAPSAIAGFARRAGWTGPDLVTAVAVALAASGGADHALETYPHGTPRQTRGLWAIDVDQVTDDQAATLNDPAANARAAFELWQAAGRSWDWSPVYRAGMWRNFAEVAERAVANPDSGPVTGGLPPGSDPTGPVRRTVAMLQTVAAAAANLANATESRIRKD